MSVPKFLALVALLCGWTLAYLGGVVGVLHNANPNDVTSGILLLSAAWVAIPALIALLAMNGS